MKITDFPQGVARLLVIVFVAVWLAAAKVFGVRVDLWPPVAQLTAMAVVVAALTFATVRLTRGGRSPD